MYPMAAPACPVLPILSLIYNNKPSAAEISWLMSCVKARKTVGGKLSKTDFTTIGKIGLLCACLSFSSGQNDIYEKRMMRTFPLICINLNPELFLCF
jgi:hypothetical protein